jgi:hypothetical protein
MKLSVKIAANPKPRAATTPTRRKACHSSVANAAPRYAIAIDARPGEEHAPAAPTVEEPPG